MEKHTFQAEVKQLLDIVINSLYTDKEIFVRELISNASDALERLRFQQVAGNAIADENLEARIALTTDSEANQITIEDTGSGMTKDDLVNNLGTIAHSGSKEFLTKVQADKDQKAALDVIGQFGVGFYSVFMVAKEVRVYTRSYLPDEKGWCWSSEGTGEYSIEEEKGLRRGTKIVISLKEDEKDFAQDYRIESIIKQYSNFVSAPIELNGKSVSTVQAIWTRSKSEITEEEYNKFYQYIGHDMEEPQYRLHFNADAPLAIKSLLFIPKKNMERMGLGRQDVQVNLYCKKVLIESKSKSLMPEWLRFVKGVVDSEDIPLNISRESMQDSALMQKLNKVITSRLLKFLDEESKKRPESFEAFYKEFSPCLKEGVATDFTHREALSKLLRFESSETESGKTTTLADYVSRMKDEQEEIFYVMAPSRASAEASPYNEVFKARGLEMLYLTDPWDEFVMEHLNEFDGKKLKSAEKADLEVDEKDREAKGGLKSDDARLLANWIKETLGDRVKDVVVSKRLVDSPAVVIDPDSHMTATMRQMMKAVQREKGAADEQASEALNMEINPSHSLMQKLNETRSKDEGLAKKVVEQVFDSAKIAAGLMDDPRTMVKRMDELMEAAL